jgi:2-polyprenyl-6-methoxyphenol hydroxylase-like FAD-dependent oxidoreductase
VRPEVWVEHHLPRTLSDGKLILVGDDLAQFRPHVGSSTNQAALDALLLEKVLEGKMGLDQWEERVLEYADLIRLRSIAFGSFYMNGHLTFTANVARYMWIFGTQELWRRWYGSAYPVSRGEI